MRISTDIIQSLNEQGVDVSSAWMWCDADVYDQSYRQVLEQPISLESLTLDFCRWKVSTVTITIRVAKSETSDVLWAGQAVLIDDSQAVPDPSTTLPLIYMSTGMVGPQPSITDNGDTTITVGPGTAVLRTDTTSYSNLLTYNLLAATFTIPQDSQTYYICAKYSNGAAAYYLEVLEGNINARTITPVYACWNILGVVSSQYFGTNGDLLPNKIDYAQIDTVPYRRSISGGLTISESNLVWSVTSALVYAGTTPLQISAMTASTSNLIKAYHAGGAWTYSVGSATYDNTNYDNGITLVALGNNKYGVRWVFRSISNPAQLMYVLGTSYYNNYDAAASELMRTDLPELISKHCILIGKAIVQSGAIAGVTLSTFDVSFAGGAISSDHNALGGIYGDAPFYHLSQPAYTKINNITALSGTGLLKLTAGTPSIDPTSYWHAGNHPTALSGYGITSADTLFNAKYLGISSNAVSSSKLANARTIALSGDGSWSVSFNGSDNVSGALTLTSLLTAGSAGSSTSVPVLTWDAKGRLTSGGSAAISIPHTQISDWGTYINQALLTTSSPTFGNAGIGTMVGYPANAWFGYSGLNTGTNYSGFYQTYVSDIGIAALSGHGVYLQVAQTQILDILGNGIIAHQPITGNLTGTASNASALGGVAASSYLLASTALSTYLPLSGGTMNAGAKIRTLQDMTISTSGNDNYVNAPFVAQRNTSDSTTTTHASIGFHNCGVNAAALFYHAGYSNFWYNDHVGGVYQLWSSKDFASQSITNWTTAYSWGNHASAGYLLASNLTWTNLGYTPVQQGGGPSMGGNKVYIGWGTDSVLRLQVDTTNFGYTWPIDISGTAAYASSVAWSNVSGRPTALSSFSNDAGYLTANQTITLSGAVTGTGTTSIATSFANTHLASINQDLTDASTPTFLGVLTSNIGSAYGQCGIFTGNADNAAYTAYNLKIKSWWGIGFESYDGITRILFDTRTGNISTLGSISEGSTALSAKYLGINASIPSSRISDWGTYINQALLTTSSPTFANATIHGAQYTVNSGVSNFAAIYGSATDISHLAYTWAFDGSHNYINASNTVHLDIAGTDLITLTSTAFAVTPASTFTGLITANGGISGNLTGHASLDIPLTGSSAITGSLLPLNTSSLWLGGPSKTWAYGFIDNLTVTKVTAGSGSWNNCSISLGGTGQYGMYLGSNLSLHIASAGNIIADTALSCSGTFAPTVINASTAITIDATYQGKMVIVGSAATADTVVTFPATGPFAGFWFFLSFRAKYSGSKYGPASGYWWLNGTSQAQQANTPFSGIVSWTGSEWVCG